MRGQRHERRVERLAAFAVAAFVASCNQEAAPPAPRPAKPSSYTPRLAAVAAAVQARIYLIGGRSASGITPLAEAFDPGTGRWTPKRAMPTPRARAAAVVTGGRIYVLGGRDASGVLDANERYDPSADSWDKRAPMPTPRAHLMAAEVDGMLYALGGIAGEGHKRTLLDTIEVYDPQRDTWRPLGRMPAKRADAAVAVLGNRIYVIGGRLASPSHPPATPRADAYDVSRDVWVDLPPLKRARRGARAVVLNGQIYVIGGTTNGEPTASVAIYDPPTRAWAAGPDLRAPRTGHCCAVAGGKAYVLAGLRSPRISCLFSSVEELCE